MSLKYLIWLLSISVIFVSNLALGEGGCQNDMPSYCDQTKLIALGLKKGDSVGLVASASSASTERVLLAQKRMKDLGLEVKLGKSVDKHYYNYAGNATERADDLNEMFRDKNIKAIFELRGGWGSKKILPYLDYELIKTNPKIIVGFSDITIILLAIYSKTGLITFHGPLPGANLWSDFTVDSMKQVIFEGKKMQFSNPKEYSIHTITSGVAKGKLIGGNLTLISRLLHNSQYLPNWEGAILFLEDVDEPSRKIDGMFEELRDAGVLDKIKGFVFGQCTKCDQADDYKKLNDLLDEFIKPLGIPAWSGAAIGHIESMFTLPIGALVEINADQGSITMLEEVIKP